MLDQITALFLLLKTASLAMSKTFFPRSLLILLLVIKSSLISLLQVFVNNSVTKLGSITAFGLKERVSEFEQVSKVRRFVLRRLSSVLTKFSKEIFQLYLADCKDLRSSPG